MWKHLYSHRIIFFPRLPKKVIEEMSLQDAFFYCDHSKRVDTLSGGQRQQPHGFFG